MSRKLLTTEQDTYLRQIAEGRSVKECTVMINEKFGTSFTVAQIRSYKGNHSIISGKKPWEFVNHEQTRLLTTEQHKWLIENSEGVSNGDLTDRFNQTYGTVLTVNQIISYKCNHGISSGLTGHFQKGHVPRNKGKKMSAEQYEKACHTMFKKGNVPGNRVPIGTEKEKAAAEKLAGSEAALENVKGSVEFKTEEEARAALLQAEDSKKQAEEVYQKVLAEAKKAANAQKQAETLISRYQQEIPEQKKCVEDRKTSYTEVMEIKQMTESEWKELVETYSREAAEEFQKTVNAYNEKKTAAQARRDSAQNAVGESKRPVLEELQKEKEVAETEYLETEKIYNQLRIDNKDDREIFDTLSSRLEERKSIVEEHARIDALYRMTSGNVSGSRMDLETYVQRYYLERILYAANRRFQEMSAGQFELRMYDLEKAGEGKNRGLDLMVYSTVTGKEREVRTLSGGESFMAALSLALGMADQIQQSSAAINLDMMFIDEGFGSLDEHSRNQAVRVLQEMAEGSRLIGIISHVSELKQEIEDQLLVNKDENGSHVKWQIS